MTNKERLAMHIKALSSAERALFEKAKSIYNETETAAPFANSSRSVAGAINASKKQLAA